ncbi:MAG: TIGR02450 family Trp-rich protein, partial [Aeromonas sobria]
MNTFSSDTLLFSKWTKESQHELTDRHYLVVACQRDAQG